MSKANINMRVGFAILIAFTIALFIGVGLEQYTHDCEKEETLARYCLKPAFHDKKKVKLYEWIEPTPKESNFFNLGEFYYQLYPPVDSVVVTEHSKYIAGTYFNGDYVREFHNKTGKDLHERKTMVASVDTSYYENTEYGNYQVWYCDTSFSADEIISIFTMRGYASIGADPCYYDTTYLFPNADSIVRDCKTEIKMTIDTMWKEVD